MIKLKILRKTLFLLISYLSALSDGFSPQIKLCSSFRTALQPRISRSRARESSPLQSGYVSPERDPEYRTMVKRSLLAPELLEAERMGDSFTGLGDFLPSPREGDVVQCPGLWPGERTFGTLRNLQLNNGTWFADVLPLSEGKSKGIYSLDKQARAIYCPVDQVAPVKAYFVRSENGYNVTMQQTVTAARADMTQGEISTHSETSTTASHSPALRASGYRALDENFTFPRKLSSQFRISSLELDMESYKQLKTRIVTDSLKLGAALSVPAWVFGGVDVGVGYSAGAFAGAAYLYLLGKRVDVLGTGVSRSSESQSITRRDEWLARSRLLMPLLLVLTLAGRHLLITDSVYSSSVGPMHLLDRGEFLGAIAGLLTNRVSLLYTEVLARMTGADWLSFLPGSFAEAARQKEAGGFGQGQLATATSAQAEAEQSLTTVVCLSGPEAGGRETVASKLLTLYSASAGAREAAQYKRTRLSLRPARWITTDQALVRKCPSHFRWVSEPEYTELTQGDESQVLYKGTLATNVFAAESPVALLAAELGLADKADSQWKDAAVAPGMKEVYFVEGAPQLIDSLARQPRLRLVSVWVSLQTKEQFVSRATAMVRASMSQARVSGTLAGMSEDQAARECAGRVASLVDGAARDVTFYMQRAPLFEFTLLNDDDDETAAELLALLDSAFQ